MTYGFPLVTEQAIDIQGSGVENQRMKLRKGKQPSFGGFRKIDLEEGCNIARRSTFTYLKKKILLTIKTKTKSYSVRTLARVLRKLSKKDIIET